MTGIDTSSTMCCESIFWAQWGWDHFLHPTFRRNVSDDYALSALNSFRNDLERTLRRRVGFLAVGERQPGCSRRHWHAVALGTADMTLEEFDALWNLQAYGQDTAAQIYDPTRLFRGLPGVGYLMKQVNNPDSFFYERNLKTFPRNGN